MHYSRPAAAHGVRVAQVLLTQEDVSHRERYLNARNTLMTLLGFKVLPVINEDDTVAVEEIKVGDNDNLAALVAALIDADLLVLLSDIDGLYTGDPRRDVDGRRIARVDTITPEMEARAGAGGPVGTGGMVTKLQAAQKAMAAGIPMVIADGRAPRRARAVVKGEPVGTSFRAPPTGSRPGSAGLHSLCRSRGAIAVDPGARARSSSAARASCRPACSR